MIGFRGQKTEPVEALANRLNGLPLSCRGKVEECKKYSLSSSSFLLPIEVHLFLVEVRSTFGWGNDNLLKH